MHEKRVGLRQREHIRGHLWHRYSVTVDQVMVANVTLTNSRLQLYQFETLVSIAALIAETLSYGNHDRSHKIWNFISTERYILHTEALLECCYIYKEISRWKNWNHHFCRKASFLTSMQSTERHIITEILLVVSLNTH